jgi:hypothetical protein
MIVNVLILLVKVFTMLLDHFVLILFLQIEANYKCDNTNNSEDATKVYQKLISWASATGVHNWSGFEGLLPLWPFFHTLILGGSWSLSHFCGYELVAKKKLWIHFCNYFSYHPFRHTYMAIVRAIHVPWSTTVFALSGLDGLKDEFFTGP